MEPIMLVHGGADDVPAAVIPLKVAGVKKACTAGFTKLNKNNGTALDAIEAAINVMEEDEVFNCGLGSVLNEDGDIEMDAGVMMGQDLSTGGVTVVKEILHPVSLGRMVMEKTPHVLIAGDGAGRLADEWGVTRIPASELITGFAKADLELFQNPRGPCPYKERCDTVGAVALDKDGHFAAGTSTGGLTGKLVGRSSDSSKAGCGFYADDRYGAASATGHGESIVKVCLSHSVINELKSGKSPQEAIQIYVDEIVKLFNQQSGCVAISKSGDIGVYCSSRWLPWACIRGNKINFGCNPAENNEEDYL